MPGGSDGAKTRPERFDSGRRLGWAIGIICLVAVVVYGNSLGNQFVFDDNDIFVNRPEITSLANVPKVLGLTTGDMYYRPVRLISYMMDYSVFGPDPLGFHIFNILYHVLAGVFVYLIVFRMSKRNGLALLASLVFVVHPVQTDSVTYLSGRRDVLFSFFYLLGFYYFLKYIDLRRVRHAVLVVVFYILGLFSKEMAVTLPAVAFTWVWLQKVEGPGAAKKALRGAADTFRQSAYLYTTLFTAAALFVIYKTVVQNPSTAKGYYGGSVSANFLTVAEILAHYIYLLFFPFKLNADYSYNAFPVAASLLEGRVLLSIGIVAAVVFLVLRAVEKQHRLLAFSGLWFFITLLPVCQIFPHHELLAEHYLYLPMFGFSLFAAALVGKLLEAFRRRKALICALAVLVMIFFSVRTIIRNGDWKDDLTLWKKTVQTAPDCARARSNLGKSLIAHGELAWAVSELKTALKIKPDFPGALSNLGVAYGSMERYEDAVQCLEKAVAIQPHFSSAFYNLGLTLAKKGDLDRGAAAFEKAIELDPTMTSAHYNLGLIYRRRGDLDRARDQFGKAVGPRPDSPDAVLARQALQDLEERR